MSALGRTEGGEGVRGHPPLSTASDVREQKKTLRRTSESQGSSGKHRAWWVSTEDLLESGVGRAMGPWAPFLGQHSPGQCSCVTTTV